MFDEVRWAKAECIARALYQIDKIQLIYRALEEFEPTRDEPIKEFTIPARQVIPISTKGQKSISYAGNQH